MGFAEVQRWEPVGGARLHLAPSLGAHREDPQSDEGLLPADTLKSASIVYFRRRKDPRSGEVYVLSCSCVPLLEDLCF